MEDENNYMRDYQPSVDTILRRAQEQTLLDMARQKEAMSLHIEALQTAFDSMVKTNTVLLEEKGAMLKHIADLEAALKKAVEMWDVVTPQCDIESMITGIKEQFLYLYTEPTNECEHIDYTDTLDGAVCNDCQTEIHEEE